MDKLKAILEGADPEQVLNEMTPEESTRQYVRKMCDDNTNKLWSVQETMGKLSKQALQHQFLNPQYTDNPKLTRQYRASFEKAWKSFQKNLQETLNDLGDMQSALEDAGLSD